MVVCEHVIYITFIDFSSKNILLVAFTYYIFINRLILVKMIIEYIINP